MTGVIWKYPPELRDDLRKAAHIDTADLRARLANTITRIGASQVADIELQKERNAALEWCRANGNPHRKGTDNGN